MPNECKPRDAREARLHNWYILQDAFWHPCEWPGWVYKALLSDKKSFRDRFNLFYFFTANGMRPELAYIWVLTSDFLHNNPVFGKYTSSTYQDMNNLMAKAENGTLFTGNKQMFDMVQGKVVSM